MNKIKLSILALAFGTMLGGCDKDFLDINQNPNNPTETSITPNLATAAQLANSAARNASSYDFLNRWMGYWSASGSYSRSTVEMSYNLTNDFGAGIWNGIYYSVGQYRSIERKAASLNQQFYRGIAIAMQAFEMQNLVDVYGDVPYSKAFDIAGNIRPAYDDDEAIYKDLMVRLDTAMAAIKSAGVDPNIATQDIVFQGNKTNWAKFINTIKLRLLIYTSNTSTFNRTAEIAKIQAEGSGFLGNGLGAMAQPGYTTSKPNPYYAAHLHTESGNEADNYNRANCFYMNMMTPLADPRYTRQYRSAKSTAVTAYQKCTNYGQLPADDVNSDRTPGPGYGLIRVPTSTFTTPPTAIAASGANMPMWIMTSVEAMFLIAEATARGWLPGDPKTAYEAAVKESFTYLTLTEAQATAYLAGTDPKVAFPTGGTVAQMLVPIMWQKYFALNGLQANATWADVRRTGVVTPPLSEIAGSNPIPIRLLYPSSEYSFNKENVSAEGTISPFTSKVFWDQ